MQTTFKLSLSLSITAEQQHVAAGEVFRFVDSEMDKKVKIHSTNHLQWINSSQIGLDTTFYSG